METKGMMGGVRDRGEGTGREGGGKEKEVSEGRREGKGKGERWVGGKRWRW